MDPVRIGDDAVIDLDGFDRLVAVLAERGYRTIGPVVRDGAVVHGDIEGAADLPSGWHDVQAPGRYRLEHRDDGELFGWAVGPASWKSEFFTPQETLWRASVSETGVTLEVPGPGAQPVAIIGARPCEVAALGVLDRVLAGGAVPDERYVGRRSGAFVVAVECGEPSATCFCTSMGTGPDATASFDLSLTELLDTGHRFYVRVGSEAGAELLGSIDFGAATDEDRESRQSVLGRARAGMGSLYGDGRPGRPAGAQPGAPALGRRGRALSRLWQLHPGLPDVFLLRRQGHERRRRHGGAQSDLGLVLRHRPLLPGRRPDPSHHRLALPAMADPQARDLVGPVRHLGVRRVRTLHHLVPRGHRHHRRGGGHPGHRRRHRRRRGSGAVTGGGPRAGRGSRLRGWAPCRCRRLLASRAEYVAFEPGSLLLREGDPATVAYLITQGSVALEVYSPNRVPLLIETIGAGHVVGLSWAAPPFRSQFDACAVDDVEAVAIDTEALRAS